MIRPLLLSLLVACSGASTSSVTAPADFGKSCAADAECGNGGGKCFEFGSGARQCTLACSSAGECPVGAKGALCNGKGVCSP